MESRADRDRRFRRIIFAGLLASGVAHAALLATGRLHAGAEGDAPRDIRLFALPEIETVETAEPLEVVALREPAPEASVQRTASSGPAAAPVFASVPATLRAAIPDVKRLYRKIDVPAQAEDPKASYENVSDFLVDAVPNPRPLRPIDGRSVEELAAIAASRGRGVTVGGGICPPGHDGGLRQSPINRSIISPGAAVGPSL